MASSSSVTPASRRKPITLSKANVGDFMQQIDAVVSDCDGVLWYLTRKPVPNAVESLEKLKAAGKKVMFVTNNSVHPPWEKFDEFGIKATADEVVYPSKAIARHLQLIGFKKKAFVFGVEKCRDELRAVGITVVPERTRELTKESVPHILGSIQDDAEIGAVIVENDFNFSYMDLANAAHYLRNPDCLFLAGATESKLNILGKCIPAAGCWIRILEDLTNRKAEIFGKPGPQMVTNFLKDIHALEMQRTVFVGDMLDQDMGIAHACGMKKLLVLTGIAKREDVDTCAPELVPDFVLETIGDFADLLSQ